MDNIIINNVIYRVDVNVVFMKYFEHFLLLIHVIDANIILIIRIGQISLLVGYPIYGTYKNVCVGLAVCLSIIIPTDR